MEVLVDVLEILVFSLCLTFSLESAGKELINYYVEKRDKAISALEEKYVRHEEVSM